jgi:Winged helix DNA-binding domain
MGVLDQLGTLPDVTAERVLTEAELNRALLQRQMLLERAKLRLPKALERMGTLQAQYAPSMYIGLWSRVEGLEREALTAALEKRSVVQGTLMRSTIHLVSKADYWPIAAAVREARLEAWGKYGGRPAVLKKMPAAAKRVRARLEKEGTLPRSEIHEMLGKDSVMTNGMNVWLDLVRVPPSGTWERRRADLFALAEDWLGRGDSDYDEGVELLLKRYLGGYGPASVKDAADFTGLAPRALEPVLERMKLRRFRDEGGTELLDLPRAPLPDPETPAPPRFIPTWDAILLVHARRTRVLPEEHRPKVFSTKTPQSVPTFLVDGRVAGAWKWENGRVKLEPFERLSASVRKELGKEAERLAELHA